MLTAESIDVREKEIRAAREQFVAQHAQLVSQKTALEARVANIDGALELIAMFRKDMEAAKVTADEKAVAVAQEVAAAGDEHGAETDVAPPPRPSRRRNGAASPHAQAD